MFKLSWLITPEPTPLGIILRIAIFFLCVVNYLAAFAFNDEYFLMYVGFGFICQLIASYGRFDFWKAMISD